MRSTMQFGSLTVTAMLWHGLATYADSRVVSLADDGRKRITSTFAEVGARSGLLAAALRRLGVSRGDRVGTFQWNNTAHLEVYLGVPATGAVLHTVNIRLAPAQIAYVIDHAEDAVVIVDASLLPLLAPVLASTRAVQHLVVVGLARADTTGLPAHIAVHDYNALLAARDDTDFAWPNDLDELDAASVCYTSGTTGAPRGVVYSHRSTYLHATAICAGNMLGLTEHDRVLAVVPMFHASAWGLPYAGWLSGSDLLMPDRHLQAPSLTRFIKSEQATIAAGVPTIWNDIVRHAAIEPVDLSSLRIAGAGGSAVPLALMREFRARFGIDLLQGFGMTETSPMAAIGRPPKHAPVSEDWHWRALTGRVMAGVEARVVAPDGAVLPSDGVAVGELELRGPWVTGSYYRLEDGEKFRDGWLRTGDMATLDPRGYLRITDRAKDVIKSGGEWISSVDVENALMAHPSVAEAAVVGVPDPRWGERPFALVVAAIDRTVDPEVLSAFLSERLARWQVPDAWASVDAVPRTSVGKFDKKVIRQRYADGKYAVQRTAPLPVGGSQ